jgi:hypothetical protein
MLFERNSRERRYSRNMKMKNGRPEHRPSFSNPLIKDDSI